MSQNRLILVCACAERGLVETDAIAAAVPEGMVVSLPDLCRAAAEKSPELERIVLSVSEIHACHPRAVRALFEQTGFPLPDSVEVINRRTAAEGNGAGQEDVSDPPAWFPVIDGNRCSNCGQCLDFCLFGVYERDESGRVGVTNPYSCKNNCPACARICPEAAIIFPKSAETPINGEEIRDEDAVRSAIRVNVDEILGDDVYAALNARKQKRRALLNRKKIEQALEERKRCSGGNA